MRIILTLIMGFLSFFGKAQIVNIFKNVTPTSQGGNYYGTSLVDNQIQEDDGLYNGFPMPHQVLDGRVFSFYKKAPSHADKGPLMVKVNTLGTLSQFQVIVGGTPIQIAAFSWCQLPSGRFLIAYQDNELYTDVKLAYSDNPQNGFTFLAAVDLSAGYSSSPSPIKMIVMPSGDVRFYVYRFGAGSNPAVIQDIKITNNGTTWAWGGTMISNNTQATAAPYTDWKAHEVGVVITHNTGVDSTCKMIAVMRTNVPNDGGTYYLVKRSFNGGQTWQPVQTIEDAGTFIDDNGNSVSGPFSRGLLATFVSTNSPVDIINHNGTIYLINGVRAASGYKLRYITATPDGAFDNIWSSWTRYPSLETFNATSAGATIDCGYPILFQYRLTPGGTPLLWEQHYDVSTQPVNLGITTRRVLIKQKSIAP